ncbi:MULTISPECIES: formate dehydrogenase subunit alpha [Rhodopseudomonas]|uniref:Formate dehydrogenase n=1 Tax=Rhodopseudomonas palustris TaxID=1076 RepID=A0A0D7EUQ9_RHOPL|nr:MULTISPECIES: formate dehydrogenase subunit alpha [Rhodopseudomonas]KIZ43177.1 formate dehydrogenase [Rhodopseudomonas palustris]MDF3811856.1 formate dehydrogenase subunit alpha [Rhodopseudomonas sp. BAL398]WOK19746.1 formate dehydrogenase subunit alpha [Rhodopseudomonas sp. BAL398]
MEKFISVCPYCGSGCKLNLLVENDKVVGAEPLDGVTNQGELCLKGYYGWDFINDTKILTPRLRQPMIRRSRDAELEPVSWDEAIAYTAKRLGDIKKKHGPDSIMLTGSSRGTGNESNYIAQKFARAVIGTNNIDCCARVCHGPSVSGLMVTLGNGAMSNSICEIEDTDCILCFGYNAADSHPIVARRIIKAKEKGAKIITCDPRFIETARISDMWLGMKNGSNMALVNAFANVLITENLYDKDYVANFTEGFDEYKKTVEKYTPEYVEDITGIKASEIRKAMRMYAAAKSATILWGMGVTQWGQGVDVVKGLSGLALLTGNLGRPNVGVGPVRGQNNVQGACDMGVLPNVFPGYEYVTDPAARAKFAKAWGVPSLPDKIGMSLTDVPHAAEDGKLKAMYIFGEDPAQTEPDLDAVRKGFAALDFIIVQDIFMTKTAMYADVILPATSWGEHDGVFTSADRGFQRFYTAVSAKGDVKHDWEIYSLLATAMGYPMKYNSAEQVWTEMISLCDLYTGATYERLSGLGYIQWPCLDEKSPGTKYLYEGNKFQTKSGKGLLFASEWRPPLEKVDAEFPLGLCTVREVGHYSCRSMTGNCAALTALADEPGYVTINPADAKKLGIKDDQLVYVVSRRGKIISRAKLTDRTNLGMVYMTYQWWIGACNELTVHHVDPIAKTPEYKFAAVRVEAIADQVWAESKVQQDYTGLKQRLAAAASPADASKVVQPA